MWFQNASDQADFRPKPETKKSPHLTEMRGTSETADQSGTDLGISHVVKRLGNALEIKAHAAQGMPKMPLQEEECKVEVRIGQPSPG